MHKIILISSEIGDLDLGIALQSCVCRKVPGHGDVELRLMLIIIALRRCLLIIILIVLIIMVMMAVDHYIDRC